MKFGSVAVEDAIGAIAAHSIRAGDLVLRKGHVVDAAMAARLRAVGITAIVAARLDPDDVGEDEAAVTLARLIAGEGVRVEEPFTGRANLFATGPGLLRIDRARIDAINAIDEAVTVATLPAYKPLVPGEMIATIKIIPYAVPRTVLDAALAATGSARPLSVAPYRRHRIGVVSTLTPGLKPSVIAKTLANLQARLDPAGARTVAPAEVPHEAVPLAEALRRLAGVEAADLIVVFGASAIADRRDVIPAAIVAAGGRIVHFGMPVDPGNLLLIGALGDIPVIGAPGCARSPKENGFDWVLQRLLADIPLSGADITGMGVGGLLMEIVSRGQPRSGGEPAPDE